ncbi:MAG: alkaline phosphatase family protein [Erysipelotrichaceae bacterium]|nr:alkaline phosphatase family protein [Erysipelotrichaceae bacterium]
MSFIDYNKSILSYVSSIRNYFGLSSSYSADEKFLNYINNEKPKKIILMLIDAMGANLIEKYLSDDSFLRKNMITRVPTVFPTTTTAATTSIRNGKSPNENAWLAWTQYCKEVDDIIIPFKGDSYYHKNNYGGREFYESIVPFKDTTDELNEQGIKSRILFPSFEKDGCEDFDSMCNRLVNYSNKDDYRYIYAYWDKYDTYCHEYGPSSNICKAYLAHINYEIEHMCERLSSDTMLVVVADHGQIDVKRYYDFRGSKFEKCFLRLPAGETRSQFFYIKDEFKQEFEKMFVEEFKDDFILKNKQEVIKEKIFGEHQDHERFASFLGDYLAIAKSDLVFVNIDEEAQIKGHHAGICDDELMIPVVVYKKS